MQSAAQHFHRTHLTRLAMHGAKHPSESAGANLVQHFVWAVEIAVAVAVQKPLELIIGHQLAALQRCLN